MASQAALFVERGTSLRDMAVLCRKNAIARPIAAALAAKRLPHVVIGGHRFHDRPEIRDVIALMRVLNDPRDVVAVAPAMTRPPANPHPPPPLRPLPPPAHPPPPPPIKPLPP